ncbi:hypothetical protein DC522_13400 [Microvirga sp. KLBC 81]|uniref:hypothetical protein n=1 Tax=Microvirga sp. KLBC 81 TaxID=1862707 RepID=UPI000D52061C|nr:hypothetical protein [Microvirga sp. KLBC 81]PVE23929.1 hypothetical protein DC522_13400 [Microvirga sp. KLBC 81]
MRFRLSRAWAQARIVVMSREMGEAMAGKGEDRAQGLAERSVNTSIVHPGQSSPDHQEQGDRTASNRILTENQQREGLEKTDPDRPKPEDRHKP